MSLIGNCLYCVSRGKQPQPAMTPSWSIGRAALLGKTARLPARDGGHVYAHTGRRRVTGRHPAPSGWLPRQIVTVTKVLASSVVPIPRYLCQFGATLIASVAPTAKGQPQCICAGSSAPACRCTVICDPARQAAATPSNGVNSQTLHQSSQDGRDFIIRESTFDPGAGTGHMA